MNEARYTTRLKHGHSRKSGETPEYSIYTGMHKRCRNAGYEYYSDRGIKVCERWSGENGFIHFLADMGPRPAGKSIDRIDVNGNYEPSNCRWATQSEQGLNTRRTVRAVIDGKQVVLADFCRHNALVCYEHVKRRVEAGWSPRAAVFTPARASAPHWLRSRVPANDLTVVSR